MRDIGVVIVAAGSGTRAGGGASRGGASGGGASRGRGGVDSGSAEGNAKQFRWVAGKPMLLHSLQEFQARDDVVMVVCVLPRSHAGDPPPWLFQSDVDRLLVSVGGRARGESVLNGIQDLPAEATVVLVHDAARPLAGAATIERVVREARGGRGAVAALPVVDTLKEVDERGRIARTVPRAGLWRAQTPQGFPRAMIERAYVEARRDGVAATDDAALCERLGFEVVVVRGSERAVKITAESDFALAEAMFPLQE